MIAGIVLSQDSKLDTEIAFLGDEGLELFSAETNEELLQEIKESNPGLIAVNSGGELIREEFTEKEEELREEGYNFTPSQTESKKVKRLQGLKAALKTQMDEAPQFVRFDPHITAEELAIDGDRALESYGIDTSEIESARQFDAVLGAVTARFYQQDQFRDLGVIVPDNMEPEEPEEE